MKLPSISSPRSEKAPRGAKPNAKNRPFKNRSNATPRGCAAIASSDVSSWTNAVRSMVGAAVVGAVDWGGAFRGNRSTNEGATSSGTLNPMSSSRALTRPIFSRVSGVLRARQRTVAVHADYRQKLARLAQAAGPGRVFPGCTVGRLGTVLARVCGDLAADGFAKHALVYPYQLRHSWDCESLESGAFVHDVAAQLGHAKVSTTQDCYGPAQGNAERLARARAAIADGARGSAVPGKHPVEPYAPELPSLQNPVLGAQCAHSPLPVTEMALLAQIVEWARTRPLWQQDALRRLVEKPGLDDTDIAELVGMCKAGAGLNDVMRSRQVHRPVRHRRYA